jgi:hypothetical protein
MRTSPREIVTGIFLFLLSLAVLGGLIWANLLFTQTHSGGREFFGIWKGAQNFLMFGVSPYEKQTTNDIQFFLRGRPAEAGEYIPRVNLPLYIEAFFIPLGMIEDFTAARAVWMLIGEALLIAFAWLCVRLVSPKTYPVFLVFILMFSFFWVYGFQPFLNGSPLILSAFLLIGALSALRAEIDELSGALLALAVFCIEPGLLLIFFILFLAFTARRWRVFGGFLMANVVCFAVAFLLLPSWPLGFVRAVADYLRHGSYLTTFSLFEGWWPGVGTRIAWTFTGVLILALGFEWRAARGKDFHWVIWTASVTIAVTPLLGLPVRPFSYMLMLLPLVLIASVMRERWGRWGSWVSIAVLMLVFAGVWLLAWIGSLSLFALPLFLLALLYWMRWWALHPPRVWLDAISGRS